MTSVDPATIPATAIAQTFTIRGTGFAEDTIVRIGDLPATSKTLTDGVLTATFNTLPATAGELFLVVEKEIMTRDVAVVARA